MSFASIFVIAVVLAMDAFAAAVGSGTVIKKRKIDHAFTVALWFGAFQGLMPFAGWASGIWLRSVVSEWDHWIAFFLLTLVGSRMIWSAGDGETQGCSRDPLDPLVLLALSIATSIDALAAGVSFAMLEMSIAAPALIIGIVTFGASFVGVWVGDRLGCVFRKKTEVIGGIVLILLGIKILAGHLGS